MNSHNYIYINGDIVDGDKPSLTIANSMFQYGDGTFEDIYAYSTEVKHITSHIATLKSALDFLGIDLPHLLLDLDNTTETITRLLNKNKIFHSARVRITVSRSTDVHEPSICIETHKLNFKQYEFNTAGLLIDKFEVIKKPLNPLATINGSNRLLYVKAKQFITNRNLDNCLILNTNDRVAEAIDSNVFIVKGNKIYTPSLGEGCTPNIIRSMICDIAPSIGIDIDNQVGFNDNAILSANEVFLADPINGIRWVLGYREGRFYNGISKKIFNEIYKMTYTS